MGAYSKLPPVAQVATCKQLLHPYTDHCSLAALDMVGGALLGSAKFFGTLYLLQVALKLRHKKEKVDYPFVRKWFTLYLRSIVFGTTTGTIFIASNCLLRNILGRFSYFTVSFLPAFLGGFGIFLETHQRRGLVMNSYAGMALEAIERKLESSNVLRWSNSDKVFVFMMINAILMHSFKKIQEKPETDAGQYFWFYTPKSDEPIETDDEKALKKLAKASAKYFLTGFGFQGIKIILSNPKLLINPVDLLRALLRFNNLSLGSFLAVYVFLYQLTLRTLKLNNIAPKHDTLIAGFIAGISYKIQPNISILNTAFATLMQVLTSIWIRDDLIPKWPYGEFAMLFWNGILYHTRALEPEFCPNVMIQIMSSVTSKRSDWIYKNYKDLTKNCIT